MAIDPPMSLMHIYLSFQSSRNKLLPLFEQQPVSAGCGVKNSDLKLAGQRRGGSDCRHIRTETEHCSCANNQSRVNAGLTQARDRLIDNSH
jgi:hypothetical protein